MSYKLIDMETWERKTLFDFYEDYDLPYIIMTANVDVTKALAFAKANDVSFNLVMVYLCNQTADSILNFRYRFSGRKVFLIEHNRPEVNHLIPGTELFVAASGPWPCEDVLTFCRETHKKFAQKDEGSFVEAVAGKEDIINYTSIPWVQYTQMFRTIHKAGRDNNPKISFGKYFKEEEKVLMPLSVQVHHALMDGQHVGQFYNKLQTAIAELEV